MEGIRTDSTNTLWFNFFCIHEQYKEQVDRVVERLLQNLYVLQSQLDGVLFLKRGEVENIQEY